MAEVTMVAALNTALRDALAGDPRTLVFGEDVGEMGGVFRVTEGLQAEFGRERVFDTPIAEAGIAGSCVGLALAGWRRSSRCSSTGSRIRRSTRSSRHVAKMRERTRGRVEMPIVMRIPSFGGIRGKEHHGESPETYYVHTAGLKVVRPSTPLDAYALLPMAIADPDPVIVLEPKSRYWSKEDGELGVDGPGIGEARVLREGDACAVISYGAMVHRCLDAADQLAAEGIECRVLDLRSLDAARPRRAQRRGARDRPGDRRARSSEDARHGGRDRRAHHGGRVRSPRGPGRPRHRSGRALPAGVARAALPAERRAHLRRRPSRGDVLVPERIFLLPDLGEGLEEAEVAAWLVAEGDSVTLNQPIVEVETAKANVEIPSPYAGRIVKVHAPAGATVPVGSALVTFEVDDVERVSGEVPSIAKPSPVAASSATASASAAATPAVRKLAKQLRVDLASIHGTGPGGRVTREDLERPAAEDAEIVPLSMIRRAIAANLTKAAAVPAVTTFRTVDCSALEAYRRELDVSPLPVFVRALAAVCGSHPKLNAEWREDGIHMHRRVDVGIAVDTERGLVVPALRDAGALGIGEVAAEIARLAAAAREGTLASDAGVGTTISVSNTGSYGSESGTPLLNPPNAVTIALGVIAPGALVVMGSSRLDRPARCPAPSTTGCWTARTRVEPSRDLVATLEDPKRLRGLPR